MTILSVGIVTWNSEQYIERCLSCLKDQSFQDFELIVVDNGSVDSTVSIIKKIYPSANLIINKENTGFCGGHNLAIKESTGKFYMPYNPDIFAEPTFLEKMIDAATTGNMIGSISGKLLRFDPVENKKTKIIDSTGIYFKKNRRSLDRGAESLDVGQYDNKEYVFGASGAAPLYSKEMLEDIKINDQYFLEDFFAYREDVDLAWRAQLKGWTCVYNYEAVAYHVRNNTPEKRKQMSNFVNMHSVKNRIIMLLQNESKQGFLKHGWYFIPYDLMIIAYVLLKERSSITGLKYISKNLKLIKSRRSLIRNTSEVDNKAFLQWFGIKTSEPLNISSSNNQNTKKHVFVIGSKGIPAKYGGFETFVDQLTEYQKNPIIQYHVSCLSSNTRKEFVHNNARCFEIPVPLTGSYKALIYDVYSLLSVAKYIKQYKMNDSTIYILACRIGPVFSLLKWLLRKHNISFYVNPDGHEWKRSKWNKFIRKYWKYSEKLMIKHSDLIICDSIGIEQYINKEYKKFNPVTKFISYGTHVRKSSLSDSDEKLLSWNSKNDIRIGEYFLIVGRFVPENNYELMIKGFMESNSDKDLVIITNVEENSFYNYLLNTTGFDKDKRIKWVGTVYDNELLMKIRENAFAYLHGHEVGGTNPSLLESMGSTKLNILFDVVFNREVGQEAAVYFNRESSQLATIISQVEEFTTQEIDDYQKRAINRMANFYSWDDIINSYEKTF